jgi:thioredoxin 1
MSNIVACHFWSPTCTPCKLIAPTLADLKEEFDTVKWVSTNTHDDKDGLARTLKVVAVPTIVILKDGYEVSRHSGTGIIGYYTMFRRATA